MFKRVTALLFGLAFAAAGHAAESFEAGKHYFLIEPPQPTNTGDKVEVVEVFSYGCPACNLFRPTMEKVKAALPANAELTYLPASFNPSENWPTFQRAFYAAQALGIVDRTHEATFDAIWKDEGTLRITDPKSRRLVKKMPTVEDIGAFYATVAGIKAEDFVGVANSFAVNTKMKRADSLIKAYGVDSTPTFVIAGKYRFTASSVGSIEQVIPLLKFLVEKEAAGK